MSSEETPAEISAEQKQEFLEIIEENDSFGSSYTLSEESNQILKKIHGPQWNPQPLRIPKEYMNNYDTIKNEIIGLVTGLGDDYLKSLPAKITYYYK